MPGNLIIILIFLTFIVSCSNLDNQNDQTQVICGETKNKSFAWLHIKNVEAFDAILIKDGFAKTASKTQKSCLAIAEEDRDYQLFVRDSATKKLSLSLDLKNLAPGLSNFSLAHSQNQTLSTQVRCSEPQIFAADKLELFFKRSTVDIITHPMAEIKIFDLQENLRLQKTLSLGDSIPSLSLGLSDGQYTLEMRNFDAFTPESLAGATPEVCTLVIDSDLPVTQLKVQNFTAIADESSAFKIPPGAKLEFATEQDPAVEVYVCLKQRGDEKIQAEACDLDDFNNVGNNLNAPESGAWDLYAFSKDKAGNTSPVNHSTLYIYHDALIAEIRALSRTIQLLVDARREFEAFKNFQKLLAAGKKLTLQMEINDIYWHLLTHFDWASNKNSTVWAQTLDPGLVGEATAVSPFEDAWVTSTNEAKGGTYIYKNGALAKIQTPYYEFKFVDTLRMAGLRQEPSGETTLDLFESNRVVERRTLKNFYEDVEIDTKHGVFVLLSLIDLVLIDINNPDQQRIIPLPESVKDISHPGLEFSISPDSEHYYISFAAYILRIHSNSGAVDIFRDPKGCWIKKPDIAPTGDLYYLNYSRNSLDENCKDVYRISWSGGISNASMISENGRKYDSIAIVDVDNIPFLLSSRGKFIDIKDLSGKAPDKTLITKASGYLNRHPMYRDVLYFETENSIHLVSFAQKESHFLQSKEILVPGNKAGRAYFPTRDASKFLLIDSNEVRMHSFESQNLGIMEKVSSGTQCTLEHSKKFSLCKRSALEFQWANHDTMIQKMIRPASEIMAWQVLANGEVIFVTENRELLSWRADSESMSKIGNINLAGKLMISWFPVAQVFAVHHAIEWGKIESFYPDKYLGTLPPKTILFTKKPEGWIASSAALEGLPLPHYDLPVVLNLRATSKSAYIDVMNRDAVLINTLKSCSFENLDLQKNYVVGLASTAGRITASGSEPYLYSTCSRNVRKINIYDSTEHATFPVPDGYQAQIFDNNSWVWLENEEGSRQVMNFRTGLSGDFLDKDIWKSLTKVEWPNGTYYFSEAAVVSNHGESFTIELRPFFQTTDPFLVGLTRKNGDQTTNSIMKINPHWMDAQLKKSPLYHVERKDITP